ncbi:MAG: Ig-like domain-containing protein [Lachnospiraceae bacterium]
MKFKKLTSYVMVFFLILNLFSSVAGGNEAKALEGYGIWAESSLLESADEPLSNQLKIIYHVTDYQEETGVQLERSISKDGEETAFDVLTLSSDTYEEVLEEDGAYVICYRLVSDPEEPLILEALLDNEYPVVTVTENEDDTLGIAVSDNYIDENSFVLQYKRTFLDGFDLKEENNAVNLTLEEEEGQYSATIALQDLFKETDGEGIYQELVFKATDQSGNCTEYPISLEVIIDESNPVISVEVLDENDNVITGEIDDDGNQYFDSKSKKVKIKIADLQLQEPECEFIRNETIAISPLVNSSLEDNPYLKEIEYPFQKDGVYSLNITANDMGEPSHSEMQSRSYVRDTNGPVFGWNSPMLFYLSGEMLPMPYHEDEKEVYYLSQPAGVSFDVREMNYSTTMVSIMENAQAAEGYPKIMTENRQTFTTEYSDNGAYHVYAWAKDRAGNYCESDAVDFVIDDKHPKLAIKGIKNKKMTKDPVNLTFEATEENPDFSWYKITVERSNRNGQQSVKTYVYPENEWNVIGENCVSHALSIEKEGAYQVTFEAIDKAGNASVKYLTFSIDHTAPIISDITYSNVNGILFPQYNTIFSNKVIALEFNLYDDVVGVNPRDVYVTIGTKEDRDNDTLLYLAHEMFENHYIVYIPAEMDLTEFDSPVTIWANDKLKNESSYTSERILYTTDYAKIHMDCDTDYTKWTNKDVTFHTTIEDEKAGLDHVVFRVNDKVVKEIKFLQLTHTYSWDVTAFESADFVTGYAVEVEVTNNCGTTKKMTKQVYIDKEKPEVLLSGTDNGMHYATDKKISAYVKDVSYTNTITNYVVKRTLEGREEDIAVAPLHSTNYETWDSFTMMAEGDYEIYGITRDSAGNTTTSNSLRFVIDKTAPRLRVSGVGDGAVSGQTVSLTFECEELHYETNTVNISVERILDGKVDQYRINDFPCTGKMSSMSRSFTEDGNYVVTMSAVDKAGNEAAVQRIAFTIDRTSPVIRIEGSDNYQLWNRGPILTFMVEESYFTTNQVSITGTRRDIDGIVHEITISDFASSGKISQLSHNFKEDGIYDLVFTSKDEAGNLSREEIHFTVDKTAPDIFLADELQGGYFHDFCLAKDVNDLFRDLTVLSYKILLNGVEYNGTDKITAEGKYNLYVEAKDEVGHVSKEVAEFIIDHTAPKVIFAGVKDGQLVHEAGNVVLSLTNTADTITSVRLNGEELGAAVRSIAYTQPGSYQIDVDCSDMAGNKITRSIYFVYSEPITLLIIISVLGFLVLMAGVMLFVNSRKNRKKK